MNLWQRITQFIGFGKQKPKLGEIATLTKNPKKGFYYRVNRKATGRVKLDIERLEQAILAAENPQYTTRVYLHALYKEAMRDTHLLSQTRTIENKILSSDFHIDKDGKQLELQKKLLRRPWFKQYVKYYVESIWHGHSLVEFRPMVESPEKGIEKEFRKVLLIPREHVHPWSGQIVIDPYSQKGFDYRTNATKNILVEIGEEDDLGLLAVATKEVIYKNYSRSDWSRHSEKFGMPITVVKTSSRDEKEIDAKAEMAANIGSNGWAVLDDQDEVQLIESNKTDAYKIYLEGINFADSQVSKLIAGQTGTSDEKAFVGSAEVHERVLNTYVLSILIGLQDHINFELIPFLTRNGYPLEGCQLEFVDVKRYYGVDENKNTMPDDEEQEQDEPQKKKLSLSKVTVLDKLYTSCDCSDTKDKVLLSGDFGNVEQLIAQAIKRIYDKKTKAGDLDKGLWSKNVQLLIAAVEKAIGKSYSTIAFGDVDYELLQKLRQNIYVFAAFKNHQNIGAMVELLQDGSKVVDFATFKENAMKVGKQYNIDWLRSEYQTAIGQAQMATKWNDIQATKEELPLLRYDAVNDGRTRPAHAILDGVTLPIDDDFWKEYYPPNGWNCRCSVRQLSADNEIVKPASYPSVEEVPTSFLSNSGIDGELFNTKEHPYFKEVTTKQKKGIIKAMNEFIEQDYPNKDEE